MANSMTKEGTDFSNLGYSVSLTTEEYAVGFRKGSDLTAEYVSGRGLSMLSA